MKKDFIRFIWVVEGMTLFGECWISLFREWLVEVVSLWAVTKGHCQVLGGRCRR
jgi:hypothetical protein